MRRVLKTIFALVMALLALLMAVSSCAPQSALTAPVSSEPAPAPVSDAEAEEAGPAAPEEEIAVIRADEEAPAEQPLDAEGPSGPEEEPALAEGPTPAEEFSPAEGPAPADEPEAAAAPAPIAAPSLEKSPMADMTPAERAAAWGLPAPPEGVDLSGREFKLANSYNSITDQRPHHAYGAGVTVDEVSADAFNHFVSDAQAAGYGVTAWRGYIDYWTTLENYYEPAVFAYGSEVAAKTTFVPGCHDHQTALCIDLKLNGNDDFRGTEAWDWLLAHCAEYGIILRYPEGQESWYGTACTCPCHFRYVGVAPAKYIMENNITLEQFMLLYDWDILYVPGVK